MSLYDIGTAIYCAGIIVGLVFTVTYMVLAPWWRSAIGRMFATVGAAIVAAGVSVVVQILAGPEWSRDEVGREVLRLVGYGLFTAAMAMLLGTYLHERRKPASTLPRIRRPGNAEADPEKESTMSTTTPTPLPTWDKVKRVIRTMFEVILSIIVTLALAVIALGSFAPDVLAALAEVLPAEGYAWLAGIVAAIVALSGALARIMAIPAVNAFLTRFGLGTEPRNGITS